MRIDHAIIGCCETGDIERVSRRFGLPLDRGSRDGAGGARPTWRLAGRDTALGAKPFFTA